MSSSGPSFITRATQWDPDGDDPEPSLLVLAGSFSRAANVNSASIVAWDGSNWRGFGTGLGSPSSSPPVVARVIGLGTFQGQLVVTDGSSPAVKLWSGEQWERLGSGAPAVFNSIGESDLIEHQGSLYVGGIRSFTNSANQTVLYPLAVRVVGEDFERAGPALSSPSDVARKFISRDGGLYAVGSFTSLSDGTTLNNVARWDGTAWATIAGGTNAACSDASFINDQLHVVGTFTQAGGAAIQAVARFDGTQWRQVGDGSLISAKAIIAIDATIYVAGQTATNSGVYRLDGTSWTWLEGGFVPTRLEQDNGELIALGSTSIGQDQGVQFPAEDALRLTPDGWKALGAPYDYAENTDAVVWQGRLISQLGPRRDASLARFGEWNGVTWQEFAMPPNFLPRLATTGVRLFGFTPQSGALHIQNIFEYTSSAWIDQGSITFPEGATFARIRDVVEFASDTYLFGTFHTINGEPVQGLARRTQDGWTPVAFPTTAAVISAAVEHDGLLYLAGQFRDEDGVITSLASFDGASLSTLQGSGTSVITGLLSLDESLIVSQGSKISRWDGVAFVDYWQPSPGSQLLRPFIVDGSLWAVQSSPSSGANAYTLVRRAADASTEIMSEPLGLRQGAPFSPTPFAYPVPYGSEIHLFGSFNQIGAANLPGNRVVNNWTRFTANGIPLIVTQPADVVTSCGAPVELRAVVANGYDADGSLEYQWYLNGNALSETQFTRGVDTDTLTIPSLAQPFTGIYTLTVTNSCGTITSREVFVTGDTPDCRACAPCAADFDSDGGVTGEDVAAFFAAYEINAPCADVDASGGVDGSDLGYFFQVFEAGGC